MRLKRKFWSAQGPFTVQEAVRQHLDGGEHGGGQIEALERTVENQTKMLAVLVETISDCERLPEHCLLSDVLDGAFERIADDDHD